eukprot:CAMPEP_0206584734 /NCGR_PEP_ID=MMETSP0325_2-20121206/35935_1 /ASSEMBLY_ACC=CAM_ASM_000347 /TAXON_ID=2866 /ORGANISM="Crypthecodinium cohnii, Strain Seligo" /LENGTH=298 /DNA_ID=CAMNT_0054092021 /DNA_START=34 /DNA_END=926 /DNA_ORIENTATION=-
MPLKVIRKKPAASSSPSRSSTNFVKTRPSAVKTSVLRKPSAASKAPRGGSGGDTHGSKYESVEALWEAELKDETSRNKWYAQGEKYWKGQDASIDGVLGGFAQTHGPDIRESKRFIQWVRDRGDLVLPKGSGSVLDCGAGIGRVTAHLLREQFGTVDLIEPNRRLLDKAAADMEGDVKVRNFKWAPLQDMEVADEDYDVIWAQWVLLYLPDDDLVNFFKRCQRMLHPDGLIFVKENVVKPGGSFVVDREDNSISRTDGQYKAVFERAGLRVLHEMVQTCWPTHLIPVRMYALKPMHAR